MRKGPGKFKFIFGTTGLTRWGGLTLFRQFCKAIGLRRFLQIYVRWPVYYHRVYHPADIFLAHIFALVAGIGRIENTQSLLHNGLIPPLLGLPDFPHRDTLRTFLWRFNSQNLQSLQQAHDKFRIKLFHRLGLLYSAIIDADMTALTVFGHQESAQMGYNPRYHGKRSYAPLISSEGRKGFSLSLQLRPGNVSPSKEAWTFLEPIIEKMPNTMASSRIRVRLDASFYSKDIVRPLDGKNIGYAIVARMHKSLKSRIVSSRYHEFAEGWEAAEFTFPVSSFKKEHRFIAIRRPKSLEPKEVQRSLFTFKGYVYRRALVTNLELTPEGVWRFYCNRGFQELLLREFKNSFFMAQIPTRSFLANATYMEIILWAYDLVLAFQYLCLPEEVQHWNISTLRRELWWLPAEWVRHGSSNILRLPKQYPQQDLFFKIQKTISKVKPLI
ncbi:MAG: IS1380 family transposase [Planctomycetota bacterium]